MKRKYLMLLAAALLADTALAQMRPPAFFGGIPGRTQFQAIQMQRQQARTLLYQEALEALRKNPTAADVPLCPPGQPPQGVLCLKRPEAPAPVAAIVKPPSPEIVPAKPQPSEATLKPRPQETMAPTLEAATPAKEVAVATPPPSTPPPERRRLAVLFGNNDYKAPIPELETPIADVERIAESLRKHFGYEARVIKNASKAKIIETLNGVAASAKDTDSVLLFYAGHGYLMEDIDMGFWIPIDGSVKSPNNWISNKDISKLLAAIPARQLILVSDSCFSGSLTHEQKVNYKEAPIAEDIFKKRSVLAFSSGGDEPVSDEGKEGHSIFAWSLIKTLDAASGTTSGQQVWRTVTKEIPKEFEQSPQYGAVVSAGHTDGGEYLFQTR